MSKLADKKVAMINTILTHHPVSFIQVSLIDLRLCGITRYGLCTNQIRAKVWPLLLGINSQSYEKWQESNFYSGSDENNAYSDQIDKDAHRTFQGFEDLKEHLSNSKEELQKELKVVLNAVINHDSDIHYYQGFNEIAAIFILITGLDMGFKLSYTCARTLLRYPIPNF